MYFSASQGSRMASARSHFLRRRLVPALLGSALLLVALLSAVAPGAGVTTFRGDCNYTSCPQPTSTSVPLWVWGSLALIVLLAIVAALLIYRYERRRRPPTTSPASEEPPPGGPTQGAVGAAGADLGSPPSNGGPSTAGAEASLAAASLAAPAVASSAAGSPPATASPAAAASPAPRPAYVEGPEDVAAVPALLAPDTSRPAAAAAPASDEPDIDSLMDELDRISGEILKKDAVRPKADMKGAASATPAAEDAVSDGSAEP
jgi:hypothetical protein